jgi:putative ABC transport system permease protein
MTQYLRALAAKLRGLFGARRADQELDDEIETHLRLLTERYVRQGMNEEEAAWAARRQFGNVTLLQEVNRDMRGIRLIDTFIQDLRYGLTMLRRNPGFTFVAVLTLALGIGATTAVFSVVNAVLLRPLPYRDPDRLVLGFNARSQDFLRWRDQSKAFESMAAFRFRTADFTGSGEPERLAVGVVSVELFATLGVAPAHGRAFTPEEDRVGGEPVVVLSDSLWRRRFGSDPQVIGRALTIDSPDYPHTPQRWTVIGIMPPGFRFLGDSDLWMPLITQGWGNVAPLGDRDGKVIYGSPEIPVSVIARLKPGMTLEAARANLPVIRDRKQEESDIRPPVIIGVRRSGDTSRAPAKPINIPRERADGQISMIWLRESLIGNVRLQLLILFGAVLFVLLIACANVTNLLLSRSVVRQKEMAIRAVAGAGRLRLVRQLLTESLLLSVVGGAAGLLAAKWGVQLLVAMSPAEIARINESSPSSILDGRVLGFTSLVVVLTGLIAGIFPALQASKIDINETLKGLSTAGSARSRRGGSLRALPALMIAEFALALVLLVGAGLMIKSFLRLMAVPTGFNPDGVLTLTLSPSFANYSQESPRRIFYFQEALARVQALPGVESAGLTGFLPLTPPSTTTSGGGLVEGRPAFKPGTAQSIALNHISPDYFKTMGIQLRAGRQFAATDGKEAPRVAIINETIAKQFFPNEDPIGRRLSVGRPAPTIVGVVGDTRNSGLDQRVSYEVYLPILQQPEGNMLMSTLAVRIASDQNNPAGIASPSALAGLTAAIRDQVRAIDPNETVFPVIKMDERLSNAVAERRFQTLLLSFFSGIALVIATVGIYGVISYAVSRRTHEIGVRMALGAQAGDVLRMVLWRGMSLTLIGVTLGLAAAFALTRVLKNLLFEVSATDPGTFALIALLIVGVALIASYIPARRATKVDPLQALRHE